MTKAELQDAIMSALYEEKPVTADMVLPIAREICGADITAFNGFAAWFEQFQGYLLNRIND